MDTGTMDGETFTNRYLISVNVAVINVTCRRNFSKPEFSGNTRENYLQGYLAL